jgi:hypothetical protein
VGGAGRFSESFTSLPGAVSPTWQRARGGRKAYEQERRGEQLLVVERAAT